MKKKVSVFEFEGIASGDYECFCWAVDAQTFERMTGCKPDRYAKSRFHKNKYNLYPGEFFNEKDGTVMVSIIVQPARLKVKL